MIRQTGINLLVLPLFVACQTDELPAGWSGAKKIAIVQGACGTAGSSSNDVPETLELVSAPSNISASYNGAHFRCMQTVCGYSVDKGDTTKVLIQPCDMDPNATAGCDCQYTITFTLPSRADTQVVALYRRWDNHNHPNEPVLIASQPVPTVIR